MDALFAKLGVDNMDDAIKVISKIDPVVVSAQPIICPIYSTPDFDMKNIPIVYAELAEPVPKKQEKPKKSVRFSDSIKEKTFDEDRSEKICVKEYLHPVEEDVPEFKCRYGGYIDDTSERMVLVSNGSFNRGSKVNDLEQRESVKVVSIGEKKKYVMQNYLEAPNPIAYVCEVMLLDGDEILQHLTEEFMIDCIMHLMELYTDLEEEGSVITLSYKQGVTVSNKPRKRQRGILKSKIEQLTNIM